jgi:hypothetical protein
LLDAARAAVVSCTALSLVTTEAAWASFTGAATPDCALVLVTTVNCGATLARRQTFFEDMRALTRYMVFESWHHLMDFMIKGLKLESQLALNLRPKLDTS